MGIGAGSVRLGSTLINLIDSADLKRSLIARAHCGDKGFATFLADPLYEIFREFDRAARPPGKERRKRVCCAHSFDHPFFDHNFLSERQQVARSGDRSHTAAPPEICPDGKRAQAATPFWAN